MTNKQKAKLKAEILSVVHQSGIGIPGQKIRKALALPDGANLDNLLAELVTEGRLVQRPTLLSNGEVSFVYNMP
jgi:hypothetical protein